MGGWWPSTVSTRKTMGSSSVTAMVRANATIWERPGNESEVEELR
jgi:hypothetical protein